jgi:two-component system sensor histidine kinase MprB
MGGRESTDAAPPRALHFLGRAASAVVPHRGMPLRRRVSLAAAAAVAIAVAVAVVVCYVAVSYRLKSELDDQLEAQAAYTQATYSKEAAEMAIPAYQAFRGGSAPYGEIVAADGTVVSSTTGSGFSRASSANAAQVAAGAKPSGFSDITVSGTRICIYTVRLTGVGYDNGTIPISIVLGRPLTNNSSVLHELRLILLVVFLFAVPLAALFGRFAARRVLRPLSEVTATAEAIAETDDLSRRLAVREDDEVGQLATRFNAMLERLGASREELDESVRSQRQLVADASHELRTPITSLRTNVEVLLASPTLDADDRLLLTDVLEQSEELTTLVSDLIEVARGEIPSGSLDDIRLDRLVDDALHRARRNAPGVDYRATLTPQVVQGNPERLARAINNLLDNAAKHAGDGDVDVIVDANGLTVRDHGNGIDASDLPYVFDRFYRGVNSRSTQGSGLGLSIVHQTAEMHGGSVTAANAPDGGAILTLTLPTSAPGSELDDDAGGSGYGAGDLTTRA